MMRLYVLATCVSLIAAADVSSALGEEPPRTTGVALTILDRNGKTISGDWDAVYWMINATLFDGSKTRITFRDIASIDVLNSKTGDSRVVLRTGEVVEIATARVAPGAGPAGRITTVWPCPFTLRVASDQVGGPARKRTVQAKDIARLVFGPIGNLKRCPRDGRSFDTDYLFCPFDKTPLVWSSRGGKQGSGPTCSSCRAAGRTEWTFCPRCGRRLARE